MKIKKIIPAFLTSALCLSLTAVTVHAESASIDMIDAGYGINGGKSFTADGITAYESTLGDLSEKYDTLDFTISAADLGGRNDLLFQVYVSADNWAIWANGNETPAIEEAGKEYSFSLDVDELAASYGSDKVICDMGFQIMSATAGKVDVDYSYSFNTAEAAATVEETTAVEDTVPVSDEATEAPVTGNAPASLMALTAAVSLAAAAASRKKIKD